MIEPWIFVRGVVLSLALLWTTFGLIRTARFATRWKRRLRLVGLPDDWVRRQVLIVLARSTVLDPVNLGLLFVLLGLWSVRMSF